MCLAFTPAVAVEKGTCYRTFPGCSASGIRSARFFLILLLISCPALVAQSPLTCSVTAGVPPIVREEGFAELVGDLLLVCSGGQAGRQQTASVTLYLNTTVTSRTASNGLTEALLIVDDKVSESYRAVKGGSTNMLVWPSVVITDPGQGASRTLRITNVRANANQLPRGTDLLPAQIMSFISVAQPGPLALDYPQQVVAYIRQGLTFDTASCAGTASLPAAGISAACGGGQNNSGNRNLISGNAGNLQFNLRFRENLPTAFRKQIESGQETGAPGNWYPSESGFLSTSSYPWEVGLASQGTRLYARFTNVPAGFRVFVTTGPSAGTTAGANAVLVDNTGAYTARPLLPQTPTAMTATHTLYCPESSAAGYGAVEVPVTSGTGTAVWEVITSNPAVNEDFLFGVALAYTAPAAGTGQIQVSGSLGPGYLTDGVSSTDPLPIPRFRVSEQPALPAFNNFGGISVTPGLVTSGTTNQLTIESVDTSCVSVGTTMTFTTPGVSAAGIAAIGPGTWRVAVTVAADVANGRIVGSLATSAGSLPVALSVQEPVQSWSIGGHVSRFGVPVAGVAVVLSGSATRTTTTDASGTWTFTNLTDGGNYTVTPSLAGHIMAPAALAFNNLHANAIGDFVASPITWSISGRVTKGGSPLAGVTVALTGAGTRTTDASGSYSFSYLFDGVTYTATPSLAGHVFTPSSVTILGLAGNRTIDFSARAATGLGFYPITPCRIADTRPEQPKTGQFGPPNLFGYVHRDFRIPASSCLVPPAAQAYSLNLTAVPFGPLDFLSAWPAGESFPGVSTLNSPGGTVLANAAIVPAGTSGAITVVAGNPTHFVLDANGYFAPSAAGELRFYPVYPCRVLDTRPEQRKPAPFGAPRFAPYTSRDIPVEAAPCGIPGAAQAYALNVTAIPSGPLDFLSVWPAGRPFPGVSTLNSPDGSVIANAAIVPAGTNGAITVVTGNPAHVVIDVNGYFAPPGAPGGLRFFPVSPCRVADTRPEQGRTDPFGPPALSAYVSRDFPIRSSCGLPAEAQAYSLNFTAIPIGTLDFLSVWPAGSPYPTVSTLNAPMGRVIANAAIVPAGTNGSITVVTGNPAHLVIDLNGYFAP